MSAATPYTDKEARLQITHPDSLENNIVILVTGANS